MLTLRWSSERLLAEIDAALRASPLTVTLLPDFAIRSVVGNRRKGGLDAALAVDIQRQPLSRLDRLCKRAIDLALSLAAIALLAPLLTLTALAIRLDSPGPALFRQRRVGFDNREFVIFKFRTMTARDDGPNVPQARRDDARVTRIGRLLRRSSLDELPQLLNVIRGEMSLVGPRPHAVAHHDQYAALIGSYAFRHHVKPGLTGMAQVRGLRGETSELAAMENRVEQDSLVHRQLVARARFRDHGAHLPGAASAGRLLSHEGRTRPRVVKAALRATSRTARAVEGTTRKGRRHSPPG